MNGLRVRRLPRDDPLLASTVPGGWPPCDCIRNLAHAHYISSHLWLFSKEDVQAIQCPVIKQFMPSIWMYKVHPTLVGSKSPPAQVDMSHHWLYKHQGQVELSHHWLELSHHWLQKHQGQQKDHRCHRHGWPKRVFGSPMSVYVLPNNFCFSSRSSGTSSGCTVCLLLLFCCCYCCCAYLNFVWKCVCVCVVHGCVCLLTLRLASLSHFSYLQHSLFILGKVYIPLGF